MVLLVIYSNLKNSYFPWMFELKILHFMYLCNYHCSDNSEVVLLMVDTWMHGCTSSNNMMLCFGVMKPMAFETNLR